MKQALLVGLGFFEWPGTWAIVLACLMACCVPQGAVDQGAREALNMLSASVSPASRLASQSCDAREQLIVKRVAADKEVTAEMGKAMVADVRQKCDQLRSAFDNIRTLHDQASTFVESQQFSQALARLREAEAQFRELAPLLEEP